MSVFRLPSALLGLLLAGCAATSASSPVTGPSSTVEVASVAPRPAVQRLAPSPLTPHPGYDPDAWIAAEPDIRRALAKAGDRTWGDVFPDPALAALRPEFDKATLAAAYSKRADKGWKSEAERQDLALQSVQIAMIHTRSMVRLLTRSAPILTTPP